jgi:ACS family hexuronate transporter-like MFS transporter
VSEAPQRQRISLFAWWILALSSLDSILGMIDRQAVAILKATLKDAFQIGDSEYGILVSAFLIPYAAFYIVCGRLVDRWGSRKSLTLFILIWSFATILMGVASSFEELVVYRAILGAAEAGLVPATVYALVRWFPRDSLATAYSLRAPIVSLGPVLAPPIVAGLALAYGWRASFVVPGAIGFAFALAWWLSDREAPGDRQALSVAGLSLMDVLRSKLLWGLIAARLVSDPLWFFVQYWQAGYFQEVLGASLAQVGSILWIPPLASGLLGIGVGAWSDRLVRRGMPVIQSRVRVMWMVALISPAVLVIPHVSNVWVALALFTVAQMMALVWLTFSNILIASIFDRRSMGTAVGVVNAIGTGGAALFNLAVGPMVDSVGYTAVFTALAFLHPIASIILVWFYRGTVLPGQGDTVGASAGQLPDTRPAKA